MILNHLGKPIKTNLEETIFNSVNDRREFYDDYLKSLDQLIGLPQLDFSQLRFNNWIELFNKIQKEFKSHSPLNKVMNYAEFFNAFFINPYGLEYEESGSKHIFIDQFQQLDSKEKNVSKFNRRINIPLLLNSSIGAHQNKLKELSKSNELFEKEKLNISYEDNDNNLDGLLKAEFNNNYWKEILSNSDDCIFISHNQEEIVFREYWVASVLHQFHSKINYLSFNLERGKELKKQFPYPLIKVKLMNTSNHEFPLIVGGVLGDNLTKIKSKSKRFAEISDFIDYSIWQHFTSQFEGENLFYNLCDSMHLNKAAHQFDEYIKRSYKVKAKLGKKEKFLSIPQVDEALKVISSTKQPYLNEQFSETFAFPNKPQRNDTRVGSFVPLQGNAWGLSANSYGGLGKSKFPKGTFTAVATFFGSIALASMFYLGSLDKPDYQPLPAIQEQNVTDVQNMVNVQNIETIDVQVNQEVDVAPAPEVFKLTLEETAANEKCELSRIALMLGGIEKELAMKIEGPILELTASDDEISIDLSELEKIIENRSVGERDITLEFKDGSKIEIDSTYEYVANSDHFLRLMHIDLVRRNLGIDDKLEIEHDCTLKLSERERDLRKSLVYSLNTNVYPGPIEKPKSFAIYQNKIYYTTEWSIDLVGFQELNVVDIETGFVENRFTNLESEETYFKFPWITERDVDYYRKRRELEDKTIAVLKKIKEKYSDKLGNTLLATLGSKFDEENNNTYGEIIHYHEYLEEVSKRSLVYKLMSQIEECQPTGKEDRTTWFAHRNFIEQGHLNHLIICVEGRKVRSNDDKIYKMEKYSVGMQGSQSVWIYTSNIKNVKLTQMGKRGRLFVDGGHYLDTFHMPFDAAKEFYEFLNIFVMESASSAESSLGDSLTVPEEIIGTEEEVETLKTMDEIIQDGCKISNIKKGLLANCNYLNREYQDENGTTHHEIRSRVSFYEGPSEYSGIPVQKMCEENCLTFYLDTQYLEEIVVELIPKTPNVQLTIKHDFSTKKRATEKELEFIEKKYMMNVKDAEIIADFAQRWIN